MTSAFIHIAKEEEEKDNENKLKLLSTKNSDNFGHIGTDWNAINELIKAYYNKCIILIKYGNQHNNIRELAVTELISGMRYTNPLSELQLFIKINYYLNNNEIQKCNNMLYSHIFK